MAQKLCVVTGANKGIGYHIVRGLCRALPDARVLLCSRDLARGEEAVAKLVEEGTNLSVWWCTARVSELSSSAGFSNVMVHQLDISDGAR